MNIEDTLTEIHEEQENAIEKPKRKATAKQMAALELAREKRKTKPNALAPPPPVPPPPSPPPPAAAPVAAQVAVVAKKPKKPPKPTVIQIATSDDESSDDEPPPTIIIRQSKPKHPKIVQTPKPEPPRQYIRRAY